MSAATTSPADVSTLDLETIFEFVAALRRGDFSARLPAGLSGRAHDIAIHLNSHMRQMERLTSEIARVATELGVEGRLGPVLDVFMPPGPWKQAIDAMNALAFGLTDQVRDMVRSLTLAAAGDPSRKVIVQCDGEMAQLKNAINALLERLRSGALPAAESSRAAPVTPVDAVHASSPTA